MAEVAPIRRDEQLALWLSALLLAGGFLLFLVQLPSVVARAQEFSPWLYVPPLLALLVAVWKRADGVAWLTIFWLGIFFMIDVFYGVGFF